MTTVDSSPENITIILADDHEIFRDGFSALLNKLPGMKLLAEAADGEQLLAFSRSLKPDIVITDISMPGVDGIQATRLLTKELPGTAVIALSMFDQRHLIGEMLDAGAKGYLLKNASKKEIVDVIRAVYAGQQSTVPLENTLDLTNYFKPTDARVRQLFSPREITIIQLVCREYSNKEIAEQLGVGLRTAEKQRERILKKMNVKNTAGIVVYAVKNQLY